MPKSVKLPFCEDLCTPMPRRPRIGGLLSQRPVDDPTWQAEWWRRVELLLQHYAVDADNDPDWQTTLMVALAQDFVPGITEAEPTRRGRPRTKSTYSAQEARRHLLKAVVEKMELNPHLSNRNACLPFFAPSGRNLGLGSFEASTVDRGRTGGRDLCRKR